MTERAQTISRQTPGEPASCDPRVNGSPVPRPAGEDDVDFLTALDVALELRLIDTDVVAAADTTGMGSAIARQKVCNVRRRVRGYGRKGGIDGVVVVGREMLFTRQGVAVTKRRWAQHGGVVDADGNRVQAFERRRSKGEGGAASST